MRVVSQATAYFKRIAFGVVRAAATPTRTSRRWARRARRVTTRRPGSTTQGGSRAHGVPAARASTRTVACAPSATSKPRVDRAGLRSDTCATCHTDPHRGVFKQDCASCHNETSFAEGHLRSRDRRSFRWWTSTPAGTCAACHKNSGVVPARAARGARPALRRRDDSRRGLPRAGHGVRLLPHRRRTAASSAPACEKCHSAQDVRASRRSRTPARGPSSRGSHADLRCEQCHQPTGRPAIAGVTPATAGAFADGRPGQRRPTACASCHARRPPRAGGRHAARRCHAHRHAEVRGHRLLSCRRRTFPLDRQARPARVRGVPQGGDRARSPAGHGHARVRLTGVGTACASCHKDPHAGQLDAACQQCHSAETFTACPRTPIKKAQVAASGSSRARTSGAGVRRCHKTAAVGPRPAAGHEPVVAYRPFHHLHQLSHRHAPGRARAALRDVSQAEVSALMSRILRSRRHRLAASCSARASACGAVRDAEPAVPQPDVAFRLDGRHRTVDVRLLPCRRGVQGHADDVLRTATGCAGRTTGTGCSSDRQCEQCHRPSSWTDVPLGPRRHDGDAAQWRASSGGLLVVSPERRLQEHRGAALCSLSPTATTRRRTAPNHAAAGFPTTCEACHKRQRHVVQRASASTTRASFPLVGSHAQQSCATCHVEQRLSRYAARLRRAATATTTSGPPRPITPPPGFRRPARTATAPPMRRWRGPTFNHAAMFPLVGPACAAGVRDLPRQQRLQGHGTRLRRLPPRRVRADHGTRTTRPPASRPTCESCHRQFRSAAGGVAPASITRRCLRSSGQHAQQACATCHVNNVYKGTPRDCVGCHRDEYERTTTPNHAAAGFPTTCENCHRQLRSQLAEWHRLQPRAPCSRSSGQHAQQACATCHVNNVYKGTPRDCVGCHRTNTSGRPPEPRGGRLPDDVRDVPPALGSELAERHGFNHTAVFPLAGQHAQQACATCHVNNVFKGTPRDCVGCHRDEYEPDHGAEPRGRRLPDDVRDVPPDSDPELAEWHRLQSHGRVSARGPACAAGVCDLSRQQRVQGHATRLRRAAIATSTTAPRRPTTLRPGFRRRARAVIAPQTRPGDRGRSVTASRSPQALTDSRVPLVTRPRAPQVFTCVVCHDHSQPRMDDKHRGRTGYRYDSTACYACHPTGRG